MTRRLTVLWAFRIYGPCSFIRAATRLNCNVVEVGPVVRSHVTAGRMFQVRDGIWDVTPVEREFLRKWGGVPKRVLQDKEMR